MMKRIVALAMSVLLLLSVCPLSALAAEEVQVVVESVTATQGGYVNVCLRADRFVDVSVLDIEVFYDSAVMRLESVSNGNFFSGASVSTNTTTIGMVKISAMSVVGFNSSGYYYNDRMVVLHFRIFSDCPVGEYPIRVAVGDAYDTNLAPAAISGVSGMVTVKEAATQSFTLYNYCSKYSAQQGDTVTIQVNNNNGYAFAGADFRVEYDRDLLKLAAFELGSGLQVEGAVYSINSDNPGYGAISYASTNAISAYHLFTLTFEVLADTDTRAEVKISANDVYNDDLIPYASYSTTTSFQITKKVETPDYPDFTIATENFEIDVPGDVTVTLQGGAEVAAGDFNIHYDATVFTVASVTVNPAVLAAGALIFVNPNYGEGKIKFSYVNEKGTFPDDMELLQIVVTPVSAPTAHFVLSATGTDVYNIAYEQTQLEYVTASACIYVPSVTRPTCTEQGYTTYTCAACGDRDQDDVVNALGHDEIFHGAQEPTCTEVGWHDYVTCSRCDYTTYEEIPASGHTYESVVTAPTCAAEGYTTYTCHCGDTYTDDVVPATGDHTYDDDRDADCNECGFIRGVQTTKPGDANGDNKVNNRDLGMLQQHLNDWDVTIDTDAVDVNNDGRVNNRDLGLLQQYLNDWDVVLK